MKLHRVWLGDEPIPAEFEEYWISWRRLHPDWDFYTWGEDELDWLSNMDLFRGAHNYSEASDVARFEIIAAHGGVYVDVDVEPLRNMDPIVNAHAAFAGWEFSHRLGTAVIGGHAGHPAFTHLVDNMRSWVEAHDEETSEKRTGPVFLTTMWWKRTDVTRLHRDTFFPYGWWEKDPGVYPAHSYAVHRWAHSWGVAADA